MINEGSQNIYHFELLTAGVKNSKCSDIKIDLIQKAIETINFQISECKEPEALFRFSNAHCDLLNKFF